MTTKAKVAKAENYTVEMAAKVVADYLAGVPVEQIAESVGKSTRSIVAKLARERKEDGTPVYAKKAYVAKTGEAVQSKADLVAVIAEKLGATSEEVGSLEAATKSALKLVAAAL